MVQVQKWHDSELRKVFEMQHQTDAGQEASPAEVPATDQLVASTDAADSELSPQQEAVGQQQAVQAADRATRASEKEQTASAAAEPSPPPDSR